MAIVKITFDGGDVPVVTGDAPDSPDKPIENPVDTKGVSNEPFMFREGIFTFSLDTVIAFKPLWQTGQTINGIPLKLEFKKVV
jgi:hypothetical protein